MASQVPGRPDAPAAPAIPTKAVLGWFPAVWNSLLGRSVDFYPRIVVAGKITTPSTPAIVAEMSGLATRWDGLEATALANAIDMARQSLSEVKQQTEYQDQKATRLLTVTTFLSALSGVFFTRFIDAYPLAEVHELELAAQVGIWVVYVLFAAFVMAALSGALVIFHATRTRFKYPSSEMASRQEEDPRSLLFYSGLIQVRPQAWMKAWVKDAVPEAQISKSEVRSDLQSRYLSNLVSETYLVAAKTADKLRYLQPGQSLLAISLRCLFVWLIALGTVSALVPSLKKPPAATEVKIIGPNGLVPVEMRTPTPRPSALSSKGARPAKDSVGNATHL